MAVRATALRRRAALSKVGQRRQVVIPREICDELGLREGDFVEVTTTNGRILLNPKKLVDADDTLTPEEERIVERGFRQLKHGKYVRWEQLKHELGL